MSNERRLFRFRCPFCSSSLFERFYFTIDEIDVKEFSDEEIEKRIMEMKARQDEPHMTLTCMDCKAPVRLAKENNVVAVSFFVDEVADEPTG